MICQQVKQKLPVLATTAANADKNHLDPNHHLQNAQGIVYERSKLYLAALFPPPVFSKIKMHLNSVNKFRGKNTCKISSVSTGSSTLYFHSQVGIYSKIWGVPVRVCSQLCWNLLQNFVCACDTHTHTNGPCNFILELNGTEDEPTLEIISHNQTGSYLMLAKCTQKRTRI